MRKAVIVEPEIPENTGFIARLAANFGFSLRIVKPDFNLEEARRTASKAQEKLREAEIYGSVEEAVEDLDYVIGTKPGRGVELGDFQPRENTSVMIGRESSGLTNEELDLCDAVVHIDTKKYSSINQSHAAGILFHSMKTREQGEGLSKGQKQKIDELASGKLKQTIMDLNPEREEVGEIIKELKELRS